MKGKLSLGSQGLKVLGVSLSFVLIATAVFVVFSDTAKAPVLDIGEAVNRIRMGIDVVARHPDGEVIGSYHNDDDIATTNMATFIKWLLTEHNGASQSGSFTDSTNTGRTIVIRTSTGGNQFLNTMSQDSGAFIAIGNSSAAPALSNYGMGQIVGGYAYETACAYSGGNVTVTATVTVNTTQTTGITEAGLFSRAYISAAHYILMFRDTFTAIPANKTDTVTVTYTIQLGSTGFTDNMGIILYGLFHYTLSGTDDTVQVYDVTGAAKNTLFHCNGDANVFFDTSTGGVGTTNVGIMVGTNGTAGGLTTYNLYGAVSDLTGTYPITTDTGADYTNHTMTANIVMASSYSIQEAGFFVKAIDTGGNVITVMLWRTTFSSYDYTADDTLATTFTVKI